MINELCFRYSNRKNKRAIIFGIGLSVWITYFLFFLKEELNFINVLIVIATFFIPIHTIWSYFRLRKKSALIITTKQLICYVDSVTINLDEIEELEYKIKNVSSYLLVKLKNNEKYLAHQKWYKVPSLYFNTLLDKAPVQINLELLEGDAKNNFDKISNFLVLNNHVQDKNRQV